MAVPIITLTIRFEHDVVVARQRARKLTGLLGFESQDQVRLSTAVSELARNVFNYAGTGSIEFALEGTTAPQMLIIKIVDQGPGIQNLDEILGGTYRSKTGMGLGIVGARRLVDQFDIKTGRNAGTVVTLKKILSRRTGFLQATALEKIANDLTDKSPQNPLEDVQRQNQELLSTLAELHARQQDLIRLNRELEDTNRGVVALYAELDEKADSLRRADDMKTKFLSNMSHEFRTPLNSNLAIIGLLMDLSDGPLNAEQTKQLQFVLKNTEALSSLVNDLLDLAKIEAGKVVIRPIEFEVAELFSALRGMLKPLLLNKAVRLDFEEPVDCPMMITDEGKVSQILKNFISNALKFTERGQIIVSAHPTESGEEIDFSVSDTGIGITPEDQPLIFKEFHQVDSELQRKVKGTGLGLPLSRRLSELLGGSTRLESVVGEGSTFTARIPVRYGRVEVAAEEIHVPHPDLRRHAVLFIEDTEETRLVYEKFLRGTQFQFIGARSLREAQRILETIRPKAIVLDIALNGTYSWKFLGQIKGENSTREIPVVVVTTLDDQAKAAALGANRFGMKPVDRYWLLNQLDSLINEKPSKRILVIADRHSVRLQLRRVLEDLKYLVAENSGVDVVAEVLEKMPDLIFVDAKLEGYTPERLIGQLKQTPLIESVPVVVLTDESTNVPDHFSARRICLQDDENLDSWTTRIKEVLRDVF